MNLTERVDTFVSGGAVIAAPCRDSQPTGSSNAAMPDVSEGSPEARVIGVVERLLAARSIVRSVKPDDDLRAAGLSSLDMVSLVLSVEAEFDVLVPEQSITPMQFRSVASISALVSELLKQG